MSRMYIDAITLLNNRPTPPDSLDAKGVDGFRCCLRRYNRQIEKQIAHRDTDVVEVVRCKDCKHFTIDEGDSLGYCTCQKIPMNFVGELYPTEDFYCSYGERRTN